MTRRLPTFLATCCMALFWSAPGCVNAVSAGGCESDDECERGVCNEAGECVGPETVNLGCANDFDCDAALGQRCVEGACRGADAAGACSVTADCPLGSYCNSNSGFCQPLLEGWCRESSQCGGTATVCSSADVNVPGRCVECMQNADCSGGGICVQPGICEGGTQTGGRPTGDGGTPGGGTGSNPGGGGTGGGGTGGGGTGGDGTGGGGTGGGGTGGGGTGGGDPCVANNAYGDGVCDVGCASPDPDCDDEPAGECVVMNDCWTAGYDFDYTCEQGACVCDAAWLLQFVCNPGQTVDTRLCDCVGGTTGGGDTGGTGGGGDTGGGGTGGGGAGGETDDLCIAFGYYNDGICDSFCSQPDPDCSNGGTPGPTTGFGREHDACVDASGQLLACEVGLDCIWASDASGLPLYGACKQVCTADSECGGRNCALGFLGNGAGICGSTKVAGQGGCGFWEEGDSFCHDESRPSGGGYALLECLNGTCGYICDYEGNLEAPFACYSGTCSATTSSYAGYAVELSTCQ